MSTPRSTTEALAIASAANSPKTISRFADSDDPIVPVLFFRDENGSEWLWVEGDRSLLGSATACVESRVERQDWCNVFSQWKSFARGQERSWILGRHLAAAFRLGRAAGKELLNTTVYEMRQEGLIETARSIPGRFTLRLNERCVVESHYYPIALMGLPLGILKDVRLFDAPDSSQLASFVWPSLHQRPLTKAESDLLEPDGDGVVVISSSGPSGVVVRKRDPHSRLMMFQAQLAIDAQEELARPWERTSLRLMKEVKVR